MALRPRCPAPRAPRLIALALATLLALATAPPSAWAQAAAKRTPPARPAEKAVPPAAASQPAAPAGAAWRIGPRPAWVVDAPADERRAAPVAGSIARTEQLVDLQVNHALPRTQSYFHHRAVVSEASMLGSVSQPQIHYNPAFQTVTIHEVAILRDGKRVDRLKDARIEPMRRERQLEQLVIDGTQTLLVVLNDVRVGEPVELAYTIEGENPIFEGRIATTMEVAWATPVDLLHLRLVAPADRPLQVRGVATDLQPERLTEGRNQVLRVVRRQVPPVTEEAGTPPWFKVYPALHVSEYRSWSEVDAWARTLFAESGGPGPETQARIAALRATGLTGEALVAEALRFVQDEVRYFSASLGESSHRPKPAERTLVERLGDCKDKVVLLNALLRGLGFDARPALVSIARNRGMVNFLPSHEQFDHVISRVEVDGKVRFLDATISGQGYGLERRGYHPYGQALVVGGPGQLEPVAPPPGALHQFDFRQTWDLRSPGAASRLTTVLQARGRSAETMRGNANAGGLPRLAEALAGMQARVTPGLKPVGEPRLRDDRETNVFELTMEFEHPDLGSYAKGSIDLEVGAIEMMDFLPNPPEARRHTPFLLDTPRQITSRIEMLLPLPLPPRQAASQEVRDRHLAFQVQSQQSGDRIVVERRLDRLTDEVLPADLPAYRDTLNKLRAQIGGRVRVPLLDLQSIRAEAGPAERRVRALVGNRDDTLSRIVTDGEIDRLFATQALGIVKAGSLLDARVRAARAQSLNLMGNFTDSLRDADAALAIDASLLPALEARGVALVGLGRVDDAHAAFDRLLPTASRTLALNWQGAIDLHRGRYADAENALREVVAKGGGDERDFALLGLYLAAEHQGSGRGRAAVAEQIGQADPKRLVGAILHYLDGRIDADALLKLARERPEMERLNLAEAYYYIGRLDLARGKGEQARGWFERTVQTQALPYREVTFAALEIKRPR